MEQAIDRGQRDAVGEAVPGAGPADDVGDAEPRVVLADGNQDLGGLLAQPPGLAAILAPLRLETFEATLPVDEDPVADRRFRNPGAA